jgi:hypothetical protein
MFCVVADYTISRKAMEGAAAVSRVDGGSGSTGSIVMKAAVAGAAVVS